MSRINKRKNDEIFSDEENEPTAMTTFSNISSPSEITARKKKRATVKGITSRKSDRTKRFYLEMLELDHKFSEWSRNKEEALCRLIETGKLSPTDDPASMCTAQVELYMQCVANIKRRYKPPTGDVLTFGSGFSFQLGHPLKDGADTDSAEPRVIMGLRNMGFTSISCGGCHTLAIQENGQVWSWGGGEFGSLGLVGMEETEVPKQVKGFVPSRYEVAKGLKEVKTLSDVIGAAVEDPSVHLPLFDEKIVAIGTGDLHSLCLSETGRVYFFGSYGDGDQKKFRDAIPPDDKRFIVKYEKETLNLDEVQSDELDTTNVEVDVKELKALPPTKPPKGQQDWPLHVYQLDGEATDIDCGYGFNAAIVDKNGSKSCYTWGIGDCGELGRPVPAIKIYRDELEEVTDDKGDKVFDGNGNVKTKIVKVPDYQYDSIRQDYLVPKQVVWEDPMVNREVVAIACGGYHLLIVSKNLETGAHAIHSSGLNNYGQLGLGHEKNMDKLTEIKKLSGKTITHISAGQHHSLVADSENNLYTFGRGDYGQLGNSEKRPKAGHFQSIPHSIQLNEDKSNPRIKSVCAGSLCSFVITMDGEIYSWGFADPGVLGHEDCSDDVLRPKKLNVVSKVNKIRTKRGKTPMTADVHKVSSGGQHSAIICTLVE